MLGLELYEYIDYIFITGVIFYLYFFYLTIFGYIIFILFSRKIIKINEKIPILELILVSFAIGLSVYISFSFIILTFKVFNFFFGYLSIIIIDSCFLGYKIVQKYLTNDFKILYNNFIIFVKKRYQNIIIMSIIILILIIFQMNFQGYTIGQTKALLFKDPYVSFKNISLLLNNESMDYWNNYYYPPGYTIFCSGALLISNKFDVIYYFLKFGAIHLLFLFILMIFHLSLRISKKLYIAVVCSILFLSFYQFSFFFNCFVASQVAVFFIGVSLLLFAQDKKYLYFFGFFIPLLYFLNPMITLFFSFLIIPYTIFFLFYFERSDFKESIKVVLGVAIIAIILVIPFFIFLYSNNGKFEDLIYFYKLYAFSDVPLKEDRPEPGEGNILQIEKDMTGLFLDNFLERFHGVYFLTILIIGIFSILGFIYNSSKIGDTSENKINDYFHFICKFSLLLLLGANFFMYLFISIINMGYFLQMYFDRIFTVCCPYIITLCAFGITYFRIIIKRTIYFFQRNEIFDIKFIKNNEILKKWVTIENLFICLLIPCVINIHLRQIDEITQYRIHYRYDDPTINAYFFLIENVPENSRIFTPRFSNRIYCINDLLYNKEVFTSPFDKSASFDDFQQFFEKSNIQYVLINSSAYEFTIYLKMLESENYAVIYQNMNYYIFKIN